MTAVPKAEAGRQQSFAALRHPDCRTYLIGTMLAMMADNIEHVISYWIIFQKFHSPALAGFAVISHWTPFLLFSIYAGALADRFDPRRIIQMGMVLFALVSVAWGVLFFTDSLEMWHAVVLLTVHGMAGVLWNPAAQLLVHDIVGTTHLQSAIRLMSTSRHLGQLLGPAIGGGLLLLLGPVYGILANALFYLPLTFWLWKAPYGAAQRKAKEVKTRAVRGFGEIFATMRMIADNKIIVSMVLLGGAASLIVGNAQQAQMPEFAHDLGHDDAGIHYSVLLGANAAGALIAGLALEAKNLLPAQPRTAFILVILWCLAITAFALTSDYLVAIGVMLVAGFLNLSYSSMNQTLVQVHAPQEIRGRVIGLYNMSAQGLRAFSGVTVGIGGSLIGIHWSLALSALTLLAVTVAILSLTAWMWRPPSE